MRPDKDKITIIYVLNADGTPLQPMHSAPRARRFLREGKAVPVTNKPFTIQLTKQRENPELGSYTLGIDPGRQNIGLNVIDKNGTMIYDAKVRTDNEDIPKHMRDRREHRHARRHYERQRRQRAARSTDPKLRGREMERTLPGCEEPITCKVIKNTPARFNNRTRPEGWLTPTANSLLGTHQKAVGLVMGILPITDIALEMNRFDFQRMDDPSIRREDYGLGPLHGFDDAHDFISHEQEGRCLLCGRDGIDHYHHIVPRSEGGSDTVANLCGLCESCHDAVHKNAESAERLRSLKEGCGKRYHHLSVLNQIMPSLLGWLVSLEGVRTHVTDGYVTSSIRDAYDLPKDHDIDAWCIAVSSLASPPASAPVSFDPFLIRRFRRHDRSLIQAQQERAYYSDGGLVAKNRHKREGQVQCASLEEFRAKQSGARVSQLVVKRSRRVYHDPSRLLPGAVFLDDKGRRHVLRGTGNKGTRFFSDTLPETQSGRCITKSKCTIMAHNTGLVYL